MAKGRKQSNEKSWTKKVGWFLLLTLIVNFVGAYAFLPKPVKAVDASDHMILFWPSTDCSDVPSGWSSLSTGGGDFDTYFPRGAASYSAKAGGSATHTHSITGVTDVGIASTTGDRNSGSGATGASNTHTHTGNSASIDAGGAPTVLPKYGEMCVIQYNNGIPNGNSAIPDGAVAIFDAAPPAGWSDYSSTFSAGSDTFIRGGTNNTGGDNAHGGTTHSITNITMGAVSGSISGQSSSKSLSSTTHAHATSTAVSDTPDVQPPYMDIYLGQKSSAGAIPNGMVAMFDDADGSVGFSVAGWTRLSDGGGPFNNRFLKVTDSYGTPGGNTNHTHATINATSGSGGDDSNTGKAGTGGPIMTHAHSVDITLTADANTNIPPYTDVVIAKKQTVTTVLSTDKGAYGGGETIAVSTTVNNYHASTNLANTYIDAVIFEDTGTADGQPTVGETYITNGCAGSAAWNTGNYTHQNTSVNVNSGSSANDNWNCDNTNFPDNTTYTLWTRWWDGASYNYNIYYDKSVTFTSVPTLTELLFMALVGCAVFLGVRTGAIKLRRNPDIDPDGEPPVVDPPKTDNLIEKHHQIKRSIDGSHHKKKES